MISNVLKISTQQDAVTFIFVLTRTTSHLAQFLYPGLVRFIGVDVALYHGLFAWVDPATGCLPCIFKCLLLSLVQCLHVDRYHCHGMVVLWAVGVPPVRVL